jgi:chromosome segregation ATPase
LQQGVDLVACSQELDIKNKLLEESSVRIEALLQSADNSLEENERFRTENSALETELDNMREEYELMKKYVDHLEGKQNELAEKGEIQDAELEACYQRMQGMMEHLQQETELKTSTMERCTELAAESEKSQIEAGKSRRAYEALKWDWDQLIKSSSNTLDQMQQYSRENSSLKEFNQQISSQLDSAVLEIHSLVSVRDRLQDDINKLILQNDLQASLEQQIDALTVSLEELSTIEMKLRSELIQKNQQYKSELSKIRKEGVSRMTEEGLLEIFNKLKMDREYSEYTKEVSGALMNSIQGSRQVMKAILDIHSEFQWLPLPELRAIPFAHPINILLWLKMWEHLDKKGLEAPEYVRTSMEMKLSLHTMLAEMMLEAGVYVDVVDINGVEKELWAVGEEIGWIEGEYMLAMKANQVHDGEVECGGRRYVLGDRLRFFPPFHPK